MPKKPTDSQVIATHTVLPGDTNAMGTAFGGKIMQWIDLAAAIAARRHAGRLAVTASMDSLQFITPVLLGDVLVLKVSVNRVWRSSMEVGVRVECEHGPTTDTAHAASAYLTFVALDEWKRPVVVEPLEPVTDVEKRRYEQAELRRQLRLQHRGLPK